MRRIGLGMTVCAAALFAAAPASAQNSKVVGHWRGGLKVAPNLELTLIFHVVEKEGILSATMDSPDQGANGMKVRSAAFKDGSLQLEMPDIKGKYVGKPDAKGETLAGEWSQGGMSLPLVLNRFDPAKVKTAAIPKELEGIWEGKLAGLELRLVLKVAKGKDGKLAAAFRSPDQTDQDLPISSLTLEGKTVTAVSKVLNATFTGSLDAARTTIDGTWKQGPASLPLKLRKTEKESQVRRPQLPKGPFPYESVEVAYENPAAKLKLAGTLTKPKGPGPFAAAIMITGSGQQDRDETLFGHKPFLVIADALARRGVAVLRVDDRGVGGSTGSAAEATSADFAGDVRAGIDYLKSRKDVDPKRIGLIGHSEGGLIGPMVAAERPGDVAFLVLIAGPGLDGATIVRTQTEAILKAMGAPGKDVAEQIELIDMLVSISRSEGDSTKAKAKILDEFKKHLAKLPKEKRAEYEAQGTVGEAKLAMFATPWFRFFLDYDPRPTIAKVKCPILAINGAKDLQVPAKENLKAIAEACAKGGNARLTVAELPDLNHLLQTCKTGAPTEYAGIEETVAPSALKLLCDWVAERTSSK